MLFSSTIFAARNIKSDQEQDNITSTTSSLLISQNPPLSSLSEHFLLVFSRFSNRITATPVRETTTTTTAAARRMEATSFTSFWNQMHQVVLTATTKAQQQHNNEPNTINSTKRIKKSRHITRRHSILSDNSFSARRLCNLNNSSSSSSPSSVIFLITLITFVLSILAGGNSSLALSAETAQNKQSTQINGVTKAYAEPIKWSFGGWAPLDGAQKNSSLSQSTTTTATHISGNIDQLNAKSTSSPSSSSIFASPSQSSSTTTRTTSRPNSTPPPPSQPPPAHHQAVARQQLNNFTKPYEIRQQPQQLPPRDALSESASNSRENVHFASPSQPEPFSIQQSRNNPMQLHTGPAYSLPLQRPPQFSPPAPKPIIREQLLPSMNNEQQMRFNNIYPQQMPMNQQQQQQHQRHLQQMQQFHRMPGFLKHQQHMQHLHQQQVMHHQMMMQRQQQMQQQQQVRPNNMQHQAAMQQHQQKGYNMQRPMMDNVQQPSRSIPKYPGSPLMHHQHNQQQQLPPNHNQHHQNQQQQYQQQQQQRQRGQDMPPVGAFKIIEGEHPIIFSGPQLNERIPMIEVSANQMMKPNGGGYRNETNGDERQQVSGDKGFEPTASTQSIPPSFSSTLAAIEKDNLNYQNALNQVTNYSPQEEQQHSNNIQDIKQKQQQQQQQQNPIGEPGKGSGSKPSYLTIPVAVETEGDKVLTPDDINEIEKHVINVLPNLKTADKIVKIADAQLSLANIKSAAENHQKQQQQQQHQEQEQHQQAGKMPDIHQMNYEDHRTTMKQLEGDIKQQQHEQQQQQQQQHYGSSSSAAADQQVTHAPSGYGSSVPASLNQATTTSAHHVEDSSPPPQRDQQQQQQIMAEHQYFVATGPLQEIGTVDPDQVADYNLIKNDLLNNFRYEPTRANSANKQQQQHTASTPPMPYSVSLSLPQSQYNMRGSGGGGGANNHNNNQAGAPTVTRYFHQGTTMSLQPHSQPPTPRPYSRGNTLFGRLNPIRSGNQQQQQQLTSTTKTIMGGRKVSEVMRPLIHTTPVPMTSPIHVPSVEPEKVDAIQLIAGQANDKQPMVVEAHQLVNHTPDGGIDYNSGMQQQQQQQPQMQQPEMPLHSTRLHQQQIHHQHHQQQQNHSAYEQQAGDRQQQQYAPPMAQDSPDNNQNAIIEYVAISDQALNNAMAKQQQPSNVQQQQQQQQGYEISNGPEVQPVYVQEQQAQQQQRLPQQIVESSNGDNSNNRAPFMYDYTISTQNQQALDGNTMQPTPPTYMANTEPVMMSQPEAQPSLAWSPSVANEHQQQQVELSEHAVGPMQQLEMPATAGYNFFGQQQQQQQQQQHSTPAVQMQQQEYEDQQQKQHESNQRWRTNAGGSQPNPDAQYDGQIVKGSQEQESQNNQQEQQAIEEQQQQQRQQYYGVQQQQPVELTRLTSASSQKPQEDRSEQQIQLVENQQNLNDNGLNEEPYQQQNLQQNQYQMSTPSVNQQQQQQQQQMVEEYPSTNTYVAGAQINHQNNNHHHQTSSNYDQQQPSTQTDRFAYMKLDRDRQQNHLAQQQAQHQAQLAEIMNNQQEANYQTTTPMSLTTLAAIEQQQQQQDVQNQQEQQQQEQQSLSNTNNNNNNNNDNNSNTYIVEPQQQQQVQPRPSLVQSSPDSMLVNESPMQVPILDQQSLITESNEEFSDDDGANKQRQQSQPAGVYQVYQAYYAPKDHKPLPGYVRLSLDEFNELFRDAEIQYVDRNLKPTATATQIQPQKYQQQYNTIRNPQQQSQLVEPDQANVYEQQSPNEVMKASASENHQSIVVDRRSITENRQTPTNNSSSPAAAAASAETLASNVDRRFNDQTNKNRPDKKLKLGRAVKKIISIRNSNRQLYKQAKPTRGILNANLDILNPTTSATFVSSSTSTNLTDLDKVQATTTTATRMNKLKQQAKLVQPGKRKSEINGNKKVFNQQAIKSKSVTIEATTEKIDDDKKNLDDKKTN